MIDSIFSRSYTFLKNNGVELDFNTNKPEEALKLLAERINQSDTTILEKMGYDLLNLDYGKFDLFRKADHKKVLSNWLERIKSLSTILDENPALLLSVKLSLNPEINIIETQYCWESFYFDSPDFVKNLSKSRKKTYFIQRMTYFGFVEEKQLKGWEILLWQLGNNEKITGNDILMLLNADTKNQPSIKEQVIHFISEQIVYYNALIMAN